AEVGGGRAAVVAAGGGGGYGAPPRRAARVGGPAVPDPAAAPRRAALVGRGVARPVEHVARPAGGPGASGVRVGDVACVPEDGGDGDGGVGVHGSGDR